MPEKVLVTGGSGYIGTAVTRYLRSQGHITYVVDTQEPKFPTLMSVTDITNFSSVANIFKDFKPDSVIHLAAQHEVGRSVTDPAIFYHTNVSATINLLNLCIKHQCNKFVFSSSSSVYGSTQVLPTPETQECKPESPYARTKFMTEQILADYSRAYDFNYVSLRYFNAAGAMPDIGHGYTQHPASHLIPILCHKALSDDVVMINGCNYDTSDGTAARDYTHVCDIADAHVAALNFLNSAQYSDTFNIGAGSSSTVLEVLNLVEKFHGHKIKTSMGPIRPGDVSQTCADISKAREILGWVPERTMEDIISTAYQWQKTQL